MTTEHTNILERGSRFKKLLAISATALIATVALATPAWAGAGGDRRIEVDYSIDYVLVEGYPDDGQQVRIEVFRGATATPDSGVEIGQFEGTTSADPQGRAGNILEVNHFGGGQFPNGDCWQEPATPDILPGDKIQATIVTGTNAGNVDYTFVRNLDFVDEGGSFTGTATGVENPDGTFDVNAPIVVGDAEAGGASISAKRVGSAIEDEQNVVPNPTNGAFSVPIAGTGGETFVEFLNPNAVGEGDEATVSGPRGTAGEEGVGCPDLAQTAMTSVSSDVINLANVNTDLTISGVAQSGVTGVSVALGGKNYTATPANGLWTVTVPAADLAALPQGASDIVATFQGGAAPGPQTRTIEKDTIAPAAATATPPAGAYNVTQAVSLNAEDGAKIHYTIGTNPADPTATSTLYNGQIQVSASQTIKARVFDAAGNPSAVATFDYTIRRASALTMRMATTDLKLGKVRTISGKVAPAHSGKVELTIKKAGKDVVRNLKLENSRYSFTYEPPRAGRYTVKVAFAGDDDHMGSRVTKKFKVVG